MRGHYSPAIPSRQRASTPDGPPGRLRQLPGHDRRSANCETHRGPDRGKGTCVTCVYGIGTGHKRHIRHQPATHTHNDTRHKAGWRRVVGLRPRPLENATQKMTCPKPTRRCRPPTAITSSPTDEVPWGELPSPPGILSRPACCTASCSALRRRLLHVSWSLPKPSHPEGSRSVCPTDVTTCHHDDGRGQQGSHPPHPVR